MRILTELIGLPGGEFEMGQENGREDERPVHRVTLAPFAISRCPVVNLDYDAFLNATGRARSEYRGRDGFSDPRHPVVAVNWFDAVAFCNWLSQQSGRRFRLPTEAEWEYAARGGLRGADYPWGAEPPSTRPGYAGRWRQGPELAGTGNANGFGLYDMCENVKEWCADWYGARYYCDSPGENPKGPARGTRRSARGGSWRLQVKVARCAARSSLSPTFRYADFGFRVVCAVE